MNNSITETDVFCIDFTDSTTDGSVHIANNTQQTFSYGFSPNNLSQTAAPGTAINVTKGNKLYIAGNNIVNRLFTSNTNKANAWSIEGNNVKLLGNINYLLGDPTVSVFGSYAFASIFRDNDSIVDASKLVFPDTVGPFFCPSMFINCTNLVTAPELPATKMASNCYVNMFWNCSSLTTAPELPAIELAETCYFGMFQNCINLVTAPELPATKMADFCYYEMFSGCSRLNYVKCLTTDISASACTYNWLSGVASTGTFVKARSMNGWSTGTSGIPSGWTVVNA